MAKAKKRKPNEDTKILPTRKEYNAAKDKEDKETVIANRALIANVSERVKANLAKIRSVGDGGLKYPLSMPRFNDVEERKTNTEGPSRVSLFPQRFQ